MIVTDGGAIPAQVSIGFVLGDEKINCFLRCWEQPAGIDPKSFRVELCPQLAATRLIRLYLNYCNESENKSESIQCPIFPYSDISSMITELEGIEA